MRTVELASRLRQLLGESFRTLVATIGLGAAGGAIFSTLGMPLPWMLGAMVFTMIAAITGARVSLPGTIRNGFLPVLGVLLGSSFGPGTATDLIAWWPVLLLVAPYVLATVGLGTLYFRKVAGLQPGAAFYSAIPGGLSQAIVLADDAEGVDVGEVALIHAVRLVVVVTLIPFAFRYFSGADFARPAAAVDAFEASDALLIAGCAIAGAVGGRALRLPAAFMFGPLLLSAVLHATATATITVPPWLVAAVQVLLGAFVGARFAGSRIRELSDLVLVSAGWTLLVLAVVLSMGWLLSASVQGPTEALVLAFAPGGHPEMTMVALGMGISIPFVTTVHMVRVVLIFSMAKWMLRVMERKWRRTARGGATEPTRSQKAVDTPPPRQ